MTEPTSQSEPPIKPGFFKAFWPRLVGLLLAVIIGVVLWLGPVDVGEDLVRYWTEERSFMANAIFIGAYIGATAIFVPAAILAIGAGFLFGGPIGALIALTCRPMGALFAFYLGRYVARERVQSWIEGWDRFEAVDRLTEENPLRIVFAMRLFPVIPFNLANYVFSVTSIDWKRYFFGTILGVAPGTLVYVYVGAVASDLTAALAMEDAPGVFENTWTWIGVGAAAFVFFSIGIVLARLQWNQLVADEKSDDNEGADAAEPASE